MHPTNFGAWDFSNDLKLRSLRFIDGKIQVNSAPRLPSKQSPLSSFACASTESCKTVYRQTRERFVGMRIERQSMIQFELTSTTTQLSTIRCITLILDKLSSPNFEIEDNWRRKSALCSGKK